MAPTLIGALAATIGCGSSGPSDTGLSGQTGATATETDTTAGTGDPSGPSTSDDGTGDTGDTGCQSDLDCVDDPGGGVCDTVSGDCVASCRPESTQPCYTGPQDTENVGDCRSGISTCDADGMGYGPCIGEVLPDEEVCGNGEDDNCNGIIDDDADDDDDGWGVCSGDCCDFDGAECFDSELVNPGAYEVPDNEVDDDCDGEVDEVPEPCDMGLQSNSAEPLDYARAIDLCQMTEEDPDDPKDKIWGLISAKLTLTNGFGAPEPAQRAIRAGYGDTIAPQKNANMAVFSTGHAAGVNDQNPSFAPFESGQDMGNSSAAPQDWLFENGGEFPNPLGCLEPWSADANDPVMLTLRVRVPTNANSFSMRMSFFSAEYPEWVCSEFNDFFVALVDSTADNPADKNIAIYDDGNTIWPVGVNLVLVADGLFNQCENGEVGCARNINASYNGCSGTAELPGTGFDLADPGCGGNQSMVGGGTGWLTMSGNVTPGEVMELRLAIWDSSGHIYDALVLLDAWEWSVDAAQPGVTPQ